MSPAASPSALCAAASVPSVTGQTARHEVKPKPSNTTLPRYRLSVSSFPSEPRRLNSGATRAGSNTPALSAPSSPRAGALPTASAASAKRMTYLTNRALRSQGDRRRARAACERLVDVGFVSDRMRQRAGGDRQLHQFVELGADHA